MAIDYAAEWFGIAHQPASALILSRDRASKRFHVWAELGQAEALVSQPFATINFRRASGAAVYDHAKFAITARFRQMIEINPALAKQLRHQS